MPSHLAMFAVAGQGSRGTSGHCLGWQWRKEEGGQGEGPDPGLRLGLSKLRVASREGPVRKGLAPASKHWGGVSPELCKWPWASHLTPWCLSFPSGWWGWEGGRLYLAYTLLRAETSSAQDTSKVVGACVSAREPAWMPHAGQGSCGPLGVSQGLGKYSGRQPAPGSLLL